MIGQIPLLKNVTFSRRMRIKFNYGLKSLTPPDLTNKDFGKEAFLMLRTELDKLIVHDKSAGIDILPSGTIRPNPAELLEHDSLDEMFERLRQRYDYIFIDCAPIQLVTDTNVLVRVASHTIFVARIGLLDRRQLSALKTIRDNNVLPNMLLVLNAVDNDN